jgi:hypothetical protein
MIAYDSIYYIQQKKEGFRMVGWGRKQNKKKRNRTLSQEKSDAIEKTRSSMLRGLLSGAIERAFPPFIAAPLAQGKAGFSFQTRRFFIRSPFLVKKPTQRVDIVYLILVLINLMHH